MDIGKGHITVADGWWIHASNYLAHMQVFVMDKKKAKEFGGSEPFNRMKKDLVKEVCGPDPRLPSHLLPLPPPLFPRVIPAPKCWPSESRACCTILACPSQMTGSQGPPFSGFVYPSLTISLPAPECVKRPVCLVSGL